VVGDAHRALPAALLHLADLNRDPLFHRLDMADYADVAALALKRFKRIRISALSALLVVAAFCVNSMDVETGGRPLE
jgi:hypothetical protein